MEFDDKFEAVRLWSRLFVGTQGWIACSQWSKVLRAQVFALLESQYAVVPHKMICSDKLI